MNETINLERNKVAELEPSEITDKTVTMLSAFSIPTRLSTITEGGELVGLKFDYEGEEHSGALQILDDDFDRAIKVVTGQQTHKILELHFAVPFACPSMEAAIGLHQIAERLRKRSESLTRPAQRLSYVLISRILDAWTEQLVRSLAKPG